MNLSKPRRTTQKHDVGHVDPAHAQDIGNPRLQHVTRSLEEDDLGVTQMRKVGLRVEAMDTLPHEVPEMAQIGTGVDSDLLDIRRPVAIVGAHLRDERGIPKLAAVLQLREGGVRGVCVEEDFPLAAAG